MTEQFDNDTKKQNRQGAVPRLLYFLVFLMVIAFCVQSIYIRKLSIQVNELKMNPVVGIVEKVINSPLNIKPAAPLKTEASAAKPLVVPKPESPEVKEHVKPYVPVAVQQQKETLETETAQVLQSQIPEDELNADETVTDNVNPDTSVTDNSIQGILAQEPDKYVLRFNMQGVNKNDISVKMKGNSINVSATVRQQSKTGSGSNYVIQNESQTFNQMFSIPGDVIKSKIKSSISNDGILTITLPREAPARQVGPATN